MNAGSDIRSRSRNFRRYSDKAVHEAGLGQSVGLVEHEGEASDTLEIWDGRWEDEDVARDRRDDGCEPRESEADRVVCFQEAQEQEEKQPFAAILGCTVVMFCA